MSQTKTQLVASPLNLNGADLTFPSTQGNAGQYLRNTGTAGTLEFGTFPGSFTSYAIICDEKGSDVDGGTFTSGAWRTRDLNTEIADPDSIVSISSNQFTLGAGNYLIEASAPAYRTNRHILRLQNITSSTTVQIGSAEYTNDSDAIVTRSVLAARVSLTGSTTLEIQHRAETTSSTFGFGVDSSFTGVGSIYTIVKIFKEA